MSSYDDSNSPRYLFVLVPVVLIFGAAAVYFISAQNNQIMALEDRLQQSETELKLARVMIEDRDRELSEATAEAESVKSRLKNEAETATTLRNELSTLQVQVQNTQQGLELTILGDLTFAAGSDEITTAGLTLLSEISEAVRKNYPGHEVLVEGHTDNTPITRSSWRSNRDLGSSRALRVVEFLTQQGGLEAEKIAAVSYGDAKPVADNASEAGRRANRRAVIVILRKPEEPPATTTPTPTPIPEAAP